MHTKKRKTQNYPSDMNREHNTLSFGERFKIANDNGTLQRGADLMALAHFCLTTASMLLGETEALLDAYGLFRMDIKQSFNGLMNAFDRYYAIYMKKGNFTREENSGIAARVDQCYLMLCEFAGLPPKWKVGEPLRLEEQP